MAIYNIGFEFNFTNVFADFLIDHKKQNGINFIDYQIFVPNKAIAIKFKQALLSKSNKKVLIMPKIIPIMEIDFDIEKTKKTVSQVERLLFLTKELKLFWENMSFENILQMGKKMAFLIDETIIEEKNIIPVLKKIIGNDHSLHVQKNYSILILVMQKWQEHKIKNNLQDKSENYKNQVDVLIDYWRRNPPPGHIFIAGVDGVIKSSRKLMNAICNMENGNIILQGWQNYNTNNFNLHPMHYPGLFLKNIQNPCVIDIKQSSSKKKTVCNVQTNIENIFMQEFKNKYDEAKFIASCAIDNKNKGRSVAIVIEDQKLKTMTKGFLQKNEEDFSNLDIDFYDKSPIGIFIINCFNFLITGSSLYFKNIVFSALFTKPAPSPGPHSQSNILSSMTIARKKFLSSKNPSGVHLKFVKKYISKKCKLDFFETFATKCKNLKYISYEIMLLDMLSIEPLPKSFNPNKKIIIGSANYMRMMANDISIIGGMNDGEFQTKSNDSNFWIGGAIRNQVGLDITDKNIILSMNDFLQCIDGKTVILTRSKKESSKSLLWLEMEKYNQGEIKYKNPPPNINDHKTPPNFQSDCMARSLSASALCLLINDPYAFCAKYILKLQPINEEDILGYKNRGIINHKIIEDISNNQFFDLENYIKNIKTHSSTKYNFWKKLFKSNINWFKNFVQSFDTVYPEKPGYINLSNGFKLNCKADLIGKTKNGYEIVDFKTTSVMKKSYIRQLMIEALILDKGGFGIKGKLDKVSICHMSEKGVIKKEYQINKTMLNEAEDGIINILNSFVKNKNYIAKENDFDDFIDLKRWVGKCQKIY